MTDDISSLISRRLGLPEPRTSDGLNIAERRRPVDRCAECGAPDGPYAFISNGEHRCVRCAAGLAQDYGYRPVGMRAGDIVSLA